jgi:galactose-1-phosphate uridylyltransferase
LIQNNSQLFDALWLPLKDLEEIVKELPPDLKEEVKDFAESLLQKRKKPKQKHLRMSWAGALREYRDQYTSLELQKKALEWWGD